jgi:hypothetical protein
MLRCKMCGHDVMITLDNICLICDQPTEKQIDTIAILMVLAMEHIRADKAVIRADKVDIRTAKAV